MGEDVTRAAEYLRKADEMRVMAQRSPDAKTTAAYLELSAMWVRLAEEAGHPRAIIDFPPADQAAR